MAATSPTTPWAWSWKPTPSVAVTATGRDVAVEAAAAGVVGLAGIAGLLATGRVGRVLVGLVLVLAGAVVLLLAFDRRHAAEGKR